MAYARIIGLGKYLPEKVYDNAYMESIVETTDEWILRRTGIEERHISEDNEFTTDLSTKAALAALENAGISAEEIDLILLATVTPDYFTPSCACVVQKNIGAVNAAAIDFNTACSGFVTGVMMAKQFIENGAYKNILIIAADVLSKATDYKDRATCVLFGDAAGAAVISASDEPGVIEVEIGADGTGGDTLTMLAFKEDSEEVEKRVSGRKAMADSSQRVIEKAGLTWDDIELVVPHQANYRIVDSAIKRMGITEDKIFLTLNKYGNTSASCIPVALCEAVECGRVKKGDNVVLVGFGGGLTYGATVIKL